MKRTPSIRSSFGLFSGVEGATVGVLAVVAGSEEDETGVEDASEPEDEGVFEDSGVEEDPPGADDVASELSPQEASMPQARISASAKDNFFMVKISFMYLICTNIIPQICDFVNRSLEKTCPECKFVLFDKCFVAIL